MSTSELVGATSYFHYQFLPWLGHKDYNIEPLLKSNLSLQAQECNIKRDNLALSST